MSGYVWVWLAGLSGSQWYRCRTQVGEDSAFSTDEHLKAKLSGWDYSISRVQYLNYLRKFGVGFIAVLRVYRSVNSYRVNWTSAGFVPGLSRVSGFRPELT